ncbi:glycosyltransferase family 2 protein [Uliginosibacterium paludis]|uniref:Glycosyltransferase n=1 Tax=Uliginosibacterium paludis TaxID=1615952 RepID=A0ABV2CUF5_9RHOO
MALSSPAHEALMATQLPFLPQLSVVIPTCRRPDLLERCIHALLAQEGIHGELEIVVVDDARTPACKDVVRGYTLPLMSVRLRCIHPPAGACGPAAARNAGWRAAHGAIIAFTDDDTLPDPHWLAEGLRALTPGTGAVWGRVVVPMPEHPTDAERNTGGLHDAEFITANCFVRRDVMRRVGGFDERFKRPWREDSDLYFTLLDAGIRVLPAPAAVVVHPVRDAPPGNSIRQHRNLIFDALLYKKHPRLYRQKISAGPPLHYYLVVLAGLMLLAGLLTDTPGLCVAGALVWLALSARLAVRRLRGVSHHWLNVSDIVASSLIIPFVAVFWRLAGAWRYRVPFA